MQLKDKESAIDFQNTDFNTFTIVHPFLMNTHIVHINYFKEIILINLVGIEF